MQALAIKTATPGAALARAATTARAAPGPRRPPGPKGGGARGRAIAEGVRRRRTPGAAQRHRDSELPRPAGIEHHTETGQPLSGTSGPVRLVVPSDQAGGH
jgi:hypothetical protein